MKLLFDENLSPALSRLLADLFPGSVHIVDLAGSGVTDSQVWDLARDQGYMIVSKDNDFRQRSFVHRSPPKVIWLAVGNCRTSLIADLLRQRQADIARFESDAESSLLVVSVL